MGFWTAIVIIAVLAIGTEFVLRIVKMGTRHYENIERIKRGYPALDGSRPMGGAHTWPEPEGEYTDISNRQN